MTINLRDYSKTAAQRGWGAGWPSCSAINVAGTAIVTADRSGVRVSVHKRIARLVDLLMDATEARGYLLKGGQCGAYNCRAISGTSVASNHSWGLAIDLNWQSNPYVGPRRTDMPAWMPTLWNRYGFAWGGDYTGSKQDSMHYEFMGWPADADAMTALAIAELSGSNVTIPVVTPTVPIPTKHARLSEELAMNALAIIDANGNFRAAAICEWGTTSAVFANAWVLLGATWGAATDVKITFLGEGAKVLGQWTGSVANNDRAALNVPAGTIQVTWEGKVSNPDTLLTPTVLFAAK